MSASQSFKPPGAASKAGMWAVHGNVSPGQLNHYLLVRVLERDELHPLEDEGVCGGQQGVMHTCFGV